MASRDNVYNQILYNKQQYDAGKAAGNAGQQAWAANNANQYYNQLDKAEADSIRKMDTAGLTTYRQDMLTHNQQQQQQAQQPKPNYSPPVQGVDVDKYRTETATIQDLMDKYGFDYSRENSARQAEAEAQAKRDAVANQQRGVDSGLEGAVDALDRNYYLQGLQQQQGQANSGLNAGIASDQDLRMAMSRQAAMGDMYRDANLEHMRLNDNLGRVDLERLVREDTLHNERLNEGFQNSMSLTDANRANNQQSLDALFQQRGQDINQYQFGEDYQLREGALTGNYMNTQAKGLLEEHLNLKAQTEANWGSMTPAQRQIAKEQGDEQRRQLALQGVNIGAGANANQVQQALATNQIGQRTIDSQQLGETKRANQVNEQLARDMFNKPYTNLTRMEQAQIGLQNAQLNETIRSNKSREDLSWEQFNRPYHMLDLNQQNQLELQWSSDELAWSMFEAPFDKLTAYQKEQINESQKDRYMKAGYGEGATYDSSNFLE